MRLGSNVVEVWRHGPSTTDEYQNEVPGPLMLSHTLTGCSVQPGDGAEYVLDRSATSTVYTVWAPRGSDVKESDAVKYAGDLYEIDGPVERWSVGTALDHVVVKLKRWEG